MELFRHPSAGERGSKPIHTLCCGIIGVGSVGRNLLRLIRSKSSHLRDQFQVQLQITLLQDSSALLIADTISKSYFDLDHTLKLKQDGFKLQKVMDEKSAVIQHWCAVNDPNYSQKLEEWLSTNCVDILFEASPVNLKVNNNKFLTITS